ncbi:jg14622 [Pararge aegeria aegeria]|uniref:Jg14622 protein n=2 Tax=Pararge aegeria TaxID=116150 RepID=A0A8S4R042_9NEOP|nr:jg14622 [Pararge aegeria aegeria]
MNINGCKLTHLRFADDLVLFTDDPDTLQEMLNQLASESRKAGLTINTSKTKVMTNRHKQTIKVNNQEIEYVDEYVYLGQIISPNMQMDKELQRRVNNSWARYWSLKEVLKSKDIPMPTKSKVYNMCILPILTYGCQTWGLTKAHQQKLKVCQHRMERSMLNIKLKDKWSIRKIRKATGVTDVPRKIKRLKWRWTGHVVRSSKEKWTKEIISWYPRDGKRKKGDRSSKRVKKECSYGASCYRMNPTHLREYSHPHLETILDSWSGSGSFEIPDKYSLQRSMITDQLNIIVEKKLYEPRAGAKAQNQEGPSEDMSQDSASVSQVNTTRTQVESDSSAVHTKVNLTSEPVKKCDKSVVKTSSDKSLLVQNCETSDKLSAGSSNREKSLSPTPGLGARIRAYNIPQLGTLVGESVVAHIMRFSSTTQQCQCGVLLGSSLSAQSAPHHSERCNNNNDSVQTRRTGPWCRPRGAQRTS